MLQSLPATDRERGFPASEFTLNKSTFILRVAELAKRGWLGRMIGCKDGSIVVTAALDWHSQRTHVLERPKNRGLGQDRTWTTDKCE